VEISQDVAGRAAENAGLASRSFRDTSNNKVNIMRRSEWRRMDFNNLKGGGKVAMGIE